MPQHKPGQKSPKSTKTSGKSDVVVVVTVFDEEQTLETLITALQKQSLRPREVVIVDGGSTDQTFALLRKYSHDWPLLKVFQFRGNRSVGRNFGVSRSSAPIIAFTDAGCFPEPDWLYQLTFPFADKKVEIVSGYYRGRYNNIFQKCLIPYVLVMPDKAEKTEFFPSTRSMALRRSVWNKSGGFDIRLSHNEDYAYAHWLKKIGYKFTFNSSAIVNWLPRKNLSETFWMFLRFAYGDIQSGLFRPAVKRLVARFLMFAFLFSFAMEIPAIFLAVVIVFLSYCVWAIIKNYRYVADFRAFFWLPMLQITSDISILFGTIMGLLTPVSK